MRNTIAVLAGVVVLAACGRAPSSKWADHMGDIPFVVGQEAGMRQASASHRQPMYFFTATW